MRKILVVDRDLHLRGSIKQMLENDPEVRVTCQAGSVGEALLALTVEDVDLVITGLGAAADDLLMRTASARHRAGFLILSELAAPRQFGSNQLTRSSNPTQIADAVYGALHRVAV